MSYTGSFYANETHRSADGIIHAAVQKTIGLAMTQFSPEKFDGPWSRGGLGISPIRPKDVAATNQTTGLQGDVAGSLAWGVTAVTASTYSSWIDLNIDSRIYLVVTGIFNKTPNPQITHVKFFANGQDLPVLNIEELGLLEDPRVWFQEPIIITPTNNFKVDVTSPVTLAGVPSEQIGLLGYTVGKRAYLISTS